MSDILTAMLKKKFPIVPHIYRKFRGVADIYVKIWWWYSTFFLFLWSVHKFGSSENLQGATWRFNTVLKTAPHLPLPYQTSQLHTTPHYCFKIHFTLKPSIPWSNKWSHSLMFSFLNPVSRFSTSHACNMPHASCPIWFEHPTNILWSRNIMQLQAPQYTFAYSTQHSVRSKGRV